MIKYSFKICPIYRVKMLNFRGIAFVKVNMRDIEKFLVPLEINYPQNSDLFEMQQIN